MAALNTLGQIVESMQLHTPAAAPAAVASAAAPTIDLKALLLDVVSEKTGYPVDMLGMEMTLESDLGIDSIKRVEILSSMREREPGLPEVDTAEMAALNTLGQIVESMQVHGAVEAPMAVEQVEATPTASADLGRFVVQLCDAPAVGFSQPGLQDGVLLVNDSTGVAEALASKLNSVGIQAKVADTVDPTATAVIHLGGLQTIETPAQGMAIQQQVFKTARAIAENYTERGGLFITVQNTGGDFGLSGAGDQSWLGGIAGLTKTAALEWPKAHLKAIDIDATRLDNEAVADALFAELMAGGPELEVALNSTRQTLRAVNLEAKGNLNLIDENAVILASGGARGVTAATIIALGRATKASFVLLGRTPLVDEPAGLEQAQTDGELKRALLAQNANGSPMTPAKLGRQTKQILANREIRGTIAALQAAGSRARYEAVSVTDLGALTTVVNNVRNEWGAITGIIHGAGVLADKRIAEKTDEQFSRVVSTKLDGIQALFAATSDEPLSVIAFFSSVAARCGNQGQCDYAMANETLNKVAAAEAARRENCVVKSLGWGPWDGGMVTPALKRHFESNNIPLIPLATGAQMLVDELTHSALDQVEIVLGGEPQTSGLGAASSEIKRLAVHVNEHSYPFLVDHSIEGTPVVPVVLAMEWFARALRALYPTATLHELRDVNVFKGILLNSFFNGGQWLFIEVEDVDGAIKLRIQNESGQPHYGATATLASRLPTPDLQVALKGDLTDWNGHPVYGDVLFHGPEFQCIEKITGISDEGIQARLDGLKARTWDGQWASDTLALDGGLQLALLWTQRALGGASLPTGIESYRLLTTEPPAGKIECILRGKRMNSSRAVSDVLFTADGEVFAELRGVDTHLLPN